LCRRGFSLPAIPAGTFQSFLFRHNSFLRLGLRNRHSPALAKVLRAGLNQSRPAASARADNCLPWPYSTRVPCERGATTARTTARGTGGVSGVVGRGLVNSASAASQFSRSCPCTQPLAS
jgi:hypothetical protein